MLAIMKLITEQNWSNNRIKGYALCSMLQVYLISFGVLKILFYSKVKNGFTYDPKFVLPGIY
jgi:hypothetical protein